MLSSEDTRYNQNKANEDREIHTQRNIRSFLYDLEHGQGRMKPIPGDYYYNDDVHAINDLIVATEQFSEQMGFPI